MPRLRPGFMLAALKLVAEPNFIHATTATAHSRAMGIQVPCEPMLFSHLPMLSPTTFSASASPTPKNEKPMKYAGLSCKAFQRVPPTYNALLAAKYSTAGKYGRLLVQ